MAIVKFFDDLVSPKEFKKETLESLFDQGFATEQKIDGETFIRMTTAYFEELGDYIIQHPREMCVEYWDRLIDETRNCGIMEFIKGFCKTHATIKKLTDGEVDFCSFVEEEFK